MIGPLSTLQLSVLPPVQGVLVMLLGTYVTLELGQRVRRVRQAERTPWQLASALAWVVALCSSMLLGLTEPMSHFEIGLDVGQVAVAALSSAALALTGLSFYFRAAPTPVQGLLAAALLGAATLVAQALVLGSLGLSPGVQWSPWPLTLAWLVVSGGLAVGHALLSATQLTTSLVQRQLLAAATICMAVLVAQTLAMQAADLPGQTVLPLGSLMPAGTVATLVDVDGRHRRMDPARACGTELLLSESDRDGATDGLVLRAGEHAAQLVYLGRSHARSDLAGRPVSP